MTSMVHFERVWRERGADAVLIRSDARGLERPLKGIATERLLMGGSVSSTPANADTAGAHEF